MLIIGFLLLYLHVNNCDILRPKDNFTNINYEEDIGICRNFIFQIKINVYSWSI